MSEYAYCLFVHNFDGDGYSLNSVFTDETQAIDAMAKVADPAPNHIMAYIEKMKTNRVYATDHSEIIAKHGW